MQRRRGWFRLQQMKRDLTQNAARCGGGRRFTAETQRTPRREKKRTASSPRRARIANSSSTAWKACSTTGRITGYVTAAAPAEVLAGPHRRGDRRDRAEVRRIDQLR